MAMLLGEYNHQLDAKNRFRIPARLRKELGEEYYFAKGANHCVHIFSKAGLEELFSKAGEIKFSDLEGQKNLEAFAMSIVPATEDAQGRIVLPPELREHAMLGKDDKDLVICGAITRINIWSTKGFEERYGNQSKDFNSVIKGLGF